MSRHLVTTASCSRVRVDLGYAVDTSATRTPAGRDPPRARPASSGDFWMPDGGNEFLESARAEADPRSAESRSSS